MDQGLGSVRLNIKEQATQQTAGAHRSSVLKEQVPHHIIS
jgi:hypothetical protein